MSDDFLARWSRRKSEAKQPDAVADETAASEAQRDSQAAVDGEASCPLAEPDKLDAPPEITAEEIAALPPVEHLTSASDLAPFLHKGVPMLLRNAALRRMWVVDPAIRDYLNDAREYAYDWNVPGGVPGLGPLSPMDDVKAMVRRIFNDPGERSPVPKDEEAAAEADEPVGVERPAAVEDQDSNEAAAPRQDAERTAEPAPLPAEAEAPYPDLPAKPAAQAAPAADPRRIRRHGGATPA